MKVKLYGITHSPTGEAIVRVPRVVKVQIGNAKGPDIQVAIGKTGNWLVWCNTTDKDNKGPHRIYEGPDKEAAKWWYERALLKGTMKPPAGTKDKAGNEAKEIPIPGGRVLDRRYPSKLAYFTFGKMTASGTYEPDWDSIEAHGPYPTELDVVFTDDEGFQAAYQMWTASELKCTGDGLSANRVVTLYTSEEERAAAEKAQQEGKRHYTVTKCKLGGCGYAIAKDAKTPAPCKPHGRLQFQLIKNIRLGGVAQFDTTSIRSVSQLFSCVHQFMSFTGNGDPDRGFLAGIPLKLVLRPFKVAPQGQPAGTAYSVSLEFRAESVEALKSRIVAAGSEFRQVMLAPPKEAAPAPQHKLIESGSKIEQASSVEAAAMVGEFYDVEPTDEGSESKPISDSSQVANATESRASALADKLRTARGGPQTPAQMMQGQGPSETIQALRASAAAEPEPLPQSEPMTAEEVSDFVDSIGDPEPPEEGEPSGTLFEMPPAGVDAATTDAKKKGVKK